MISSFFYQLILAEVQLYNVGEKVGQVGRHKGQQVVGQVYLYINIMTDSCKNLDFLIRIFALPSVLTPPSPQLPSISH